MEWIRDRACVVYDGWCRNMNSAVFYSRLIPTPAMGAPPSGLIAEIFLQHTEYSHLTHLTQKHKIIIYCRYEDDILIIFDNNHSNILEIINDFQLPTSQTSVHSRNRRGLHSKLPRTIKKQNTHKPKCRHIQKAHIQGHHHTIQPPHATQIRYR